MHHRVMLCPLINFDLCDIFTYKLLSAISNIVEGSCLQFQLGFLLPFGIGLESAPLYFYIIL
jgi:hypothetical protein